jgi:hypothetical protein
VGPAEQLAHEADQALKKSLEGKTLKELADE